MRSRGGAWVAVLLLAYGCGSGSHGRSDAGDDGHVGADAGARLDGSAAADAGDDMDAGARLDASSDAGAPDRDAGPCPTARATVSLATDPDSATTDLDVEPLDTVHLDGTGSVAASGASIESYAWEVVERPAGSVSTLDPSAEEAAPDLFLDLAGDYRVALRVTDDRGAVSCERAEVTIHAGPSDALFVELVWDTPGDPDPTDHGAGAGSDLDLHLRRGGATWDTAPDDCFWMNRAPNWGDTSLTDDDPSLVIDDVDGWGPESIALRSPEGTSADPTSFDVGVFQFSDHGFGPSDATVRIYVDGALALTVTRDGLADRQFWHVARIDWPDRTVTAVDTLHPDGFP